MRARVRVSPTSGARDEERGTNALHSFAEASDRVAGSSRASAVPPSRKRPWGVTHTHVSAVSFTRDTQDGGSVDVTDGSDKGGRSKIVSKKSYLVVVVVIVVGEASSRRAVGRVLPMEMVGVASMQGLKLVIKNVGTLQRRCHWLFGFCVCVQEGGGGGRKKSNHFRNRSSRELRPSRTVVLFDVGEIAACTSVGMIAGRRRSRTRNSDP